MTAPKEPTVPAPPRTLEGLALAGGRYLIEEQIPGGGMGEVYLARDTRLPRKVAVKRIAHHMSADVGERERFRKEAERVGSLADPHIALLHDVIDERGELHLVMEFVPGHTLRERLVRLEGRPLDVEESLSIGIQCARALDAAHRKGVLHCDLKPENIMITPDGNVKVLDFGLAHAVPRLSRPDDDTGRVPSRAIARAGTAAYMAPEALEGRTMDERSDLFSLGIVLFEMLSGGHPFAESPRSARPESANRVVGRLLASDPAERIQSAEELRKELQRVRDDVRRRRETHHRRLALVASLVALPVLLAVLIPPVRLAIGKWVWLIERLPQQKRVVVLPFRDLGNDAGDQEFRDGLAFVVTSKLASLEPYEKWIDVVSASEVLAHDVGTFEKAREQLGATIVITGSVQRTELGLRVIAEVVDPKSGRVLRTLAPIDMDAGESSLLQDRVAVGVASLLELEIREQAQRLLRVGRTSNPRANESYLVARGHLARFDDPTNIDQALGGFRKAAGLDPAFALAWAGIGEAAWRKFEADKDPVWVDEARRASERALKIDPLLPEAHTSLANVHQGTGNYELAAKEYQRAIELDGSSSDAYRGLATALDAQGKRKEAEESFRQAITLYPEFWAGYNWLGVFLLRQGRYEEAITNFKRVVEISPTNPRGYLNLGAAYDYVGRKAESEAAFEKSIEVVPTHLAYFNLGGKHYYERNYGRAAALYEKALALNPDEYRSWGYLGECLHSLPGRGAGADSAFREAARLARRQLETNARDPDLLARLAGYECRLAHPLEAQRLIEQALRIGETAPETRFLALLVFEELGNRDRALELLRSVLKDGYSIEEVQNAPPLDELRKDPRFKRMTREMGLNADQAVAARR